jgi:putative restriction endonuclease
MSPKRTIFSVKLGDRGATVPLWVGKLDTQDLPMEGDQVRFTCFGEAGKGDLALIYVPRTLKAFVLLARVESSARFESAWFPRNGTVLARWSPGLTLAAARSDSVLGSWSLIRRNVTPAAQAEPVVNGVALERLTQALPGLRRWVRNSGSESRAPAKAAQAGELLQLFRQRTAALPRTTEAERLVVQRVGQDLFRAELMEYWERRCAITGLAVPELLRASHIKPWAVCKTDAERLDVFNGLLLAPHLDAAFDGGFITLADDGDVMLSQKLSPDASSLLGLTARLRVERLTAAHRAYLGWHRESVFLGEAGSGWAPRYSRVSQTSGVQSRRGRV